MERIMRMRAAVTLAVVLAGTLGAAGCSADEPDEPATVEAPTFEDCPSLIEGARPVYFTDPTGTRLAGAVRGTGRTGVVLSHMSDGDACAWDPYARRLADAGYRVLVLQFQAYGESDGAAGDGELPDNVVGGAGLLREQGVTKVVLIGASMGGVASLAAATELTPPPAAVISMSAPTVYPGADAISAVPRLTAPVLYLAGETDAGFAASARQMHAATPATTPRELVVVPSSAHGIHLLGQAGTTGERVTSAMDTFLARHAPANS
jgi:pimeloyl-ACP methyl ester carboxylesterase